MELNLQYICWRAACDAFARQAICLCRLYWWSGHSTTMRHGRKWTNWMGTCICRINYHQDSIVTLLRLLLLCHYTVAIIHLILFVDLWQHIADGWKIIHMGSFGVQIELDSWFLARQKCTDRRSFYMWILVCQGVNNLLVHSLHFAVR